MILCLPEQRVMKQLLLLFSVEKLSGSDDTPGVAQISLSVHCGDCLSHTLVLVLLPSLQLTEHLPHCSQLDHSTLYSRFLSSDEKGDGGSAVAHVGALHSGDCWSHTLVLV